MKSYKVNVNGNIYNVNIEEIDGQVIPQVVMPVTKNEPVAIKTEEPKAEESMPTGTAGSKKIEAPMPGTLLSIKVKVGDSVSEHQVVAILEAMKMENEIVSPVAGIVSSIEITQGTVNTGDVIMTLN